MAIKELFNMMKTEEGLVKKIDQYLLLEKNKEANDRKSITNSPSSALGCSRANYYQREGIKQKPIQPRVQRIFSNGDDVHERLQEWLRDEGTLMMDEVPLVHRGMEIQGHTDGIMSINQVAYEAQILEIKSINDHGFKSLHTEKEDHRAQAQTYMFCAENQRLHLLNTYGSLDELDASAPKRRLKYRRYYTHLRSGSNYTRAEKIRHKVDQHIEMDRILFKVEKPIDTAFILYENKNDQQLKSFKVKLDTDLMNAVLDKFEINNIAWRDGIKPPRECQTKKDGRWCNFVDYCFGADKHNP